ncbi:MAG: Trm112 family protein [Candidatus Aenigmarchaeota archaeon]|nr:Trm112 family protein [Candidatus Aenigmarchaeota archaeon]
MTLNKEILDILVCPKCKGELKYDKKENKLICWNCKIKFPIIDGDIPDMLIEDGKAF